MKSINTDRGTEGGTERGREGRKEEEKEGCVGIEVAEARGRGEGVDNDLF